MAAPASEPRFFGRIARWVMAHARATTALIVLATVLAVGLATNLRVDPNILEMLPTDDPTTQAIRKLNDEEGGANLLTIAISGEEPEVVDRFMRQLATEVQAWEDVDYALYALDPDLAWRLGLMGLSPGELGTIRERLKGAIALGPAIANPFIAASWLDLGPVTEKLKGDADAAVIGKSELASRLLVRPTGSAYDTDFSRPFMHKVYATLDRMDPASQGLKVAWVGGAYRHSVEDVEGIAHDLKYTALASLTMVLLFVSVAFRDVRAVLLIFVPLIVGTIWTTGFAGITVITLNTFTSFFTAVLFGLGVDFSIHLYSRYREERALGGTLEDAVIRAWDAAGPPCATAGLTSAGGFCALWAAGFKGFQHLGTLLAGGVLLCLVAVLTILPLLIIWRERRPRAVPLRKLKFRRRSKPPTYRLAPVGLLGVFLLSVAGAALLPRIGFEYDLSELRARGMAYAELDPLEQAMARASYAPVIVSYPDGDQRAADYDTVQAAIEGGTLPELQRVVAIDGVLPADQAERLSVLGEIAVLARHENIRFLPPAVQENIRRIGTSELAPLGPEDLPRGLQHMLGAADGRNRLVLMPSGNMWDLRETAELQAALERVLPGREAAGEYLAMSVLYRLVQGDAPRVAGLALLGVFLLSWFHLRNFTRALGAVAALAAGMCWAGAGLALFGVKLSMINFVGIPILMGIGVDVVIHLLHRMHEEGPGRIRVAMATTGWASGLSATTTVLSFAALSVASNQGVRSLGLLIVLGLTLVTVAAFVAVPLGWMTRWKVSGSVPDDIDAIDYDAE